MPLPIAAIIGAVQLGSAVVNTISSARMAKKQEKEARNLARQGPDPLPASIREALGKARIQASEVVSSGFTAEKSVLDGEAATATKAATRNSRNSAEAAAIAAQIHGQKGRQMNRLLSREDRRRERSQDRLASLLTTAGQFEQQNNFALQQQVAGLLGASDQNRSDARNYLPNTIAGMDIEGIAGDVAGMGGGRNRRSVASNPGVAAQVAKVNGSGVAGGVMSAPSMQAYAPNARVAGAETASVGGLPEVPYTTLDKRMQRAYIDSFDANNDASLQEVRGKNGDIPVIN